MIYMMLVRRLLIVALLGVAQIAGAQEGQTISLSRSLLKLVLFFG